MQPFLRDAEFNWLSDRAVGIYLNVTVTEKHRFGGPELICLNSYFLSVSVQLHFIKKEIENSRCFCLGRFEAVPFTSKGLPWAGDMGPSST